MTPARLRVGALLWLLTLQFFVVETVVQARYELDYSRIDDPLGLLGASVSDGAALMNASFVAQGLLVLGGLLLLRPLLAGRGASVATAMLAVAVAGLVVVGLFPLGEGSWHDFGLVLHLLGGGLGLIGLAYAVRPRSEALGTTLVLLGIVGTGLSVFDLAAATGLLGEGGTERAATYALPLGLAVAAVGLVRLAARRPVAEGADPSDDPRVRREQARAERARRARERDEALEAAAARAERRTPDGPPRPEPTAPPAADAAEDDDFDPDDPWATPRRQGDA